MSILQRLNGSQNHCIPIWLADSSSTTGNGKTGLSGASAGLIIAVRADGQAAPTVYTTAAGTIDTIATIGTYVAPTAGKCRFKEVDATNEPGSYELQLLNTLFSTPVSASWVKITIQAPASNVPVQQFLYDLQPQVDVRAFGGQAGHFQNGLPSVDVDSINQGTTTVDTLSAELDARKIGTITNTGIVATNSVFECSDITDASANVYQNAGVLVISGVNIRRRSYVISDQVGTAGHRFTIAALPVAFGSGDKIVLL